LDPDTVAVQVTDEPAAAIVGEQTTDVEDGVCTGEVEVIAIFAVTVPALSPGVSVIASSLIPSQSSPDCPLVNVAEAPTG
jgi:hypothetical protein